MHINRLVFLPLLSVLLLFLTGCIGGTTSPSQFYMLEPISDNVYKGTGGAVQKPIIILKSIRIPGYIDRPQIVTATGKNTYQLSEFNRWAEALDRNISRVLLQNLTLLVPAEVGFSKTSNEQTDFQVSINILEFHTDQQGQGGLTAQWQIAGRDGLLINRQVSYRAPVLTSDYQTIVESLNECLNRLSRDLAAELQRLAVSN